MQVYICDHCRKMIDGSPYPNIQALEYQINRHKNPTETPPPRSEAQITFYSFLAFHDVEIHLCRECQEVFQEWVAEFFRLSPFIAKKVVFKGEGKEEQTPLDSGSRPE